jgi:hypothetical protein
MKAAMLSAVLTFALAAGGTARAHEFLVYFEAGGSEFLAGPPGPGAAWYGRVVADAACYAKLPGMQGVRVSAHTDSVGPSEANRRLSLKRAERIAELLVEAGVARSLITLDGRGESQPAVAAGDETPEPLNRRAVIEHFGSPENASPCDGPTLSTPSLR